MCNEEIRKLIKKHSLKQWEVAEKANISEATFCRWMRGELDNAKKVLITGAINSLVEKEEKRSVSFSFDPSDEIKIIKSTVNANTEYVEDGEIRLIFREGKYAGWYKPGEKAEENALFPDGWMGPEIEVPFDFEERVIAVISGKRDNQTFCCCPMYATYDHDKKEWIPYDYPDLIPDKVWCWTFSPELPQVCRDEINKYHGGESRESKTER